MEKLYAVLQFLTLLCLVMGAGGLILSGMIGLLLQKLK